MFEGFFKNGKEHNDGLEANEVFIVPPYVTTVEAIETGNENSSGTTGASIEFYKLTFQGTKTWEITKKADNIDGTFAVGGD